MAESTPYLLPNTQGRYVTVPVTNTSGEVYRINDDGTRTIYADYFVENGNTILESSTFASEEFNRNLAQNSQGYRSTIGNSIIQASGGPTQTAAPNSDQQGGSAPITQPTTGTELTAAMLVYPEDLGSTEQDRIKFQALKYVPRGLPDNTSGQFESIKPNYEIADIPVFLPIQSPITDQNSVGWEGDTLNPIELKAVQLSLSLMQNENMEQLQQEVAKTFTAAMNTLKKESQAVRTYLAGQAVGVNNLLSRLDGQVLNPNLELLFQGPQLRPFNFTFKMSARNRPEAIIIKKIIKYFKQNMSSSVGDNGLFLKAPNIFKIEYQKGRTTKHRSINLIKECALTNCSVDYTPLGSYMTYSDDEATMIAYTMTLSFQELTPVYDRDYLTGEGKDHPIGY
jgi:hypothetical protein